MIHRKHPVVQCLARFEGTRIDNLKIWMAEKSMSVTGIFKQVTSWLLLAKDIALIPFVEISHSLNLCRNFCVQLCKATFYYWYIFEKLLKKTLRGSFVKTVMHSVIIVRAQTGYFTQAVKYISAMKLDTTDLIPNLFFCIHFHYTLPC